MRKEVEYGGEGRKGREGKERKEETRGEKRDTEDLGVAGTNSSPWCWAVCRQRSSCWWPGLALFPRTPDTVSPQAANSLASQLARAPVTEFPHSY